MSISTAELTANLKDRASALGFLLTGVCPAVSPSGITQLNEWLDRGYAGEMNYLASRHEAYEHPRHVLDGARSIMMLGLPYSTVPPQANSSGQGRISRYAWGTGDYHDIIHDKLRLLTEFHLELTPTAKVRGVVDTAPLLEREFAQLAGLGWVGKNTLLLHKPNGSYFFLAALLTDQELIPDEPFTAEHCGTCRACLDACPTNAFPEPYVLDATRCISYLTIELRKSIPADLRSGIGDWLFGCDVCQDVCPWNHRAPLATDPALAPMDGNNPVDLIALFDLDDEAFRRRFRQTPLWRAKRRGILRNAAIVLGNQRAQPAIPALLRALSDKEPLIRGACAWALGQIGGDHAIEQLLQCLSGEADQSVRDELQQAIALHRQAASSQSAEP